MENNLEKIELERTIERYKFNFKSNVCEISDMSIELGNDFKQYALVYTDRDFKKEGSVKVIDFNYDVLKERESARKVLFDIIEREKETGEII